VSDVTELASGPITASGDGITAQLIHPTDRTSVIMIVWPAVVSKFLILGGRSKLQLFGGGPPHTAGAQKLTPKLHRAPLPSLD
jgi:hypothetical protein